MMREDESLSGRQATASNVGRFPRHISDEKQLVKILGSHPAPGVRTGEKMLVKINLGNVEILNRETIIEQLQRGNDKISLILKPTWYSEFATIFHAWSVEGWTEEELNANPGLQCYAAFLKSNGEFNMDLELDEIPEEEPED